MGFKNYKAFVDAHESGQTHFTYFRKQQSFATASHWVDMSMASGSPPPNFYASDPLTAAVLPRSKGIYCGDDVSPKSKYLVEWGMSSLLVGPVFLADYLLYYPFIDLGNTTEQVMDNSVMLPRYEDGAGVEMMMVVQAPTNTGVSLSIQYINADGAARSVSAYINNGSVNISGIPTAFAGSTFVTAGPFVRLSRPNEGVRRITAANPLAPVDGLVSLVLVKPLAASQVYENNTWREQSFTGRSGSAPRILDGAILNMIYSARGNAAGSGITGYLKTVWN